MSALERKSISLLRVFATILILCCHLVPFSNNSILQMSAQFFNVGVSVFLVLSGYLYGKRKITETSDYKTWLIKRGKRILIPLYLFLIILLFIYIKKGIKINPFNWIVYIFNLQAMEVYLNGAEHLWYLTIAMLCYIVTILLDIMREKFNRKNIIWLMIIIVFTQAIVTYFVSSQWGIYMLYIELYISAYFIGMNWNYSKICTKYFIEFALLFVIAAVIRVGSRYLFDDTILYNVIIVGYTQALIAFSIFFIVFYLVSEFGKNSDFKFINHFDSISYEIYLVHYMFIVGPIGLMGVTNSVLINSLIVILCTYLVARFLHRVSEIICISKVSKVPA